MAKYATTLYKLLVQILATKQRAQKLTRQNLYIHISFEPDPVKDNYWEMKLRKCWKPKPSSSIQPNGHC